MEAGECLLHHASLGQVKACCKSFEDSAHQNGLQFRSLEGFAAFLGLFALNLFGAKSHVQLHVSKSRPGWSYVGAQSMSSVGDSLWIFPSFCSHQTSFPNRIH